MYSCFSSAGGSWLPQSVSRNIRIPCQYIDIWLLERPVEKSAPGVEKRMYIKRARILAGALLIYFDWSNTLDRLMRLFRAEENDNSS